MNKFWIGLGTACLLTASTVQAMAKRELLLGPTSQRVQVDCAMVRAVMDNNRWGYSLAEYCYPAIFDAGLTYWIRATIFFNNQKFTSIDEAERFYVEVYADFFRTINSFRIIRPFLATFPLTPDTCRLTISFNAGTRQQELRPPYVSAIVMDEDSLKFEQLIGFKGVAGRSYAPIGVRSPREIDGLKELYSYPVPRKPAEPKPILPTFADNAWEFQSQVIQAHIAFLKKFCNRNSLQLVTIGCVGKHCFDSRLFGFVLCGNKRLTLQEARTLGARCAQEMFEFISTDPNCLKRVIESTLWLREKYRSPAPIPENIAFRISFWDENIDRQPQPYIAEIRCLDGKLEYFTADENQFISQVFEETFNEAQDFLKTQTPS